MGSFGERMKREREMRAITIEQIAESTKIGSRMLHALEREDFAKLPGGIFNKGFVRAYAKYLGLDEEQAVTDFMAVYNEFQKKNDQPLPGEIGMNGNGLSPAEAAAIAETIANTKSMSGDRRRPAQGAGLIAAGAVLVVVLGAGGFFFKYYEGKKAMAAVATAKPHTGNRKLRTNATSVPLDTSASPAVVAPTGSALSSDSINSVLAANAATPDRMANPQETSYPEFSNAPSDDPAAPSASKRSKKGKVNLEIRAKEESWVRITGDGRLLMEGILSPSASRQFNAARELVVKLGNAGMVDISYNGKPLPAFSPETKTKTITFTPEGETSQ